MTAISATHVLRYSATGTGAGLATIVLDPTTVLSLVGADPVLAPAPNLSTLTPVTCYQVLISHFSSSPFTMYYFYDQGWHNIIITFR